MKHYFSKKVTVVLVLAVLLAVVLTAVSSMTDRNLPEMAVQGFLTPIKRAATALTDQAEQIYSYIFEYETLAAENAALKSQIAQMEDDARKAAAYALENQRLRNLLELKENNEDYTLVDSYVISWDSTDWTNRITINRGQESGIAENMCAITDKGEVVGIVCEVGQGYAVIKTVLDSSLELSGNIASSGYNGMVQGGYRSGSKDLLRMNYLSSSAVIRNNDQVVTSGSTVYPRDLILGYVVDAGFDDTGVAKFALLEPAADFSSLKQVFILTGYDAR